MEFENLLSLIQAVSDSELTGLKYEEKGVKIHLTKKEDKVQMIGAPAMPQPPFAAEAAMPENRMEAAVMPDAVQGVPAQNSGMDLAGSVVESPLVGTFYTASSEDAEAFVKVGDTVKKGQTLAIIEAMKLMNEIESDYDGTITEILVENGQPVEYGQPLFCIS